MGQSYNIIYWQQIEQIEHGSYTVNEFHSLHKLRFQAVK